MLATFAALSDPNRLRIVELLRSGPKAVNDLVAELDVTQPQVSKHLRVLRDAGLVDVEAKAQQRLYELRPDGLKKLHAWVEQYRALWDARLDAMDELVSELVQEEKNRGRKKH